MEKVEYGLQLYSVRDAAEKDFRGTLEAVAALGYRYVEFAGFFGYSAEEVKGWLDEYGLIASGTHTGMDALLPENIDATIAYHKTIGCDNLIVPGADWSTLEKLDANIALLNEAQKKLNENGIALGYHNHSSEFLTTEYGKVIYDELTARTAVELEVDTFWAFNALEDPIRLLDAYKDRIRVIHLKDGIPCAEENRVFGREYTGVQGRSVGSGKAPVEAVRQWALDNGVRMVIESEGLEPTGLEEVERCIRFLRTLD